MVFSLVGGVILLVLALINLSATRTPIFWKLLILPVIIGLVGGLILGISRKKRLETSREVSRSAIELKKQLLEVEARKEETKNLLRMVEGIPLPVYLKDKQHRYLLANEKYLKLTGKSRSEVMGQTDHDIFPEPIAELFREQDLTVEKMGQEKTYEETIPLVDGIVTFETFKFPLRKKDGDIYAVGGICTDITKQKDSEDSFNLVQDRMNQIFEQMDEGVIATDCDARIIMFNRRAGEMTESSTSSSVGRMLEQVYKPKDKQTGADITFWGTKEGKKSPRERKDHEVILRTELGRAIPVIQNTSIIYDRFGQNMGLLIMFKEEEKESGLTVPLKQESMEYMDTEETSQSTENTKRSEEAITILIMDDDPLIRKTCTLMLATKGYETILAENGQEALDLYRSYLETENPIKAVVMDLTVPGAMGGVEATEKILQIDPQARIMVASGYSNDPIMANFRDYGFLARVEKPFAIQKLIGAIEEILAPDNS